MQQKNKKTEYLSKKAGKLIKNLRKNFTGDSVNKFAFENDIDKGNLSRLENGLNDPKLSTLWKISEGFKIPLSDVIKKLEQELPKDWHINEK